MRKITELKEEKELFRSGKDENGRRIKIPYTANVTHHVAVVSGWARFGHYLIDAVILYILNFILGIVLALVAPQALFLPQIYFTLFSLIMLVMYYFICESTMQRTIGKLATNSIVIDEYGKKPSTGALIGRSFARLVPFEAFSCLGERGWHDQWSKTYVVTKSENQILQRLLQQDEGFYMSEDKDILD